jgi:hypothetical protein
VALEFGEMRQIETSGRPGTEPGAGLILSVLSQAGTSLCQSIAKSESTHPKTTTLKLTRPPGRAAIHELARTQALVSF